MSAQEEVPGWCSKMTELCAASETLHLLAPACSESGRSSIIYFLYLVYPLPIANFNHLHFNTVILLALTLNSLNEF